MMWGNRSKAREKLSLLPNRNLCSCENHLKRIFTLASNFWSKFYDYLCNFLFQASDMKRLTKYKLTILAKRLSARVT